MMRTRGRALANETGGRVSLAAGKTITSVLVFGLLILPCSLRGLSPSKRLTFGVYGGWSASRAAAFSWHMRSSRSDDYTPDFHLGSYAQYNFSKVLGIQLDLNYQHVNNDWIFSYPGFPYEEGTERFSFFSANLNGIFSDRRRGPITFYVLAGGGMTFGDWEAFTGTYFNLIAGAGIKVHISRAYPNLALHIGGAFVFLIDRESYGSETADYLKLQAGIEF
jgi:opacity protein-like surface antigen